MGKREELIREVVASVVDVLRAEGVEVTGSKELTAMIPVSVSARHIHLSKEHVAYLYGEGYELKPFKQISQPNQYACEEQVTIEGPRMSIERVRILGPTRGQTQVEVSRQDARVLGLDPPVRHSGHLASSAPITIIGPNGRRLQLDEGCMIADRHIHMTPKDAQLYRVVDGQKVAVEVFGEKAGVMKNVTIRVKDTYALDMHIDTDDANAFMINGQGKVKLITE
ncbi:phosphate propanoyltransferase [Salipaludibacillus daqingensis]|uniref:phosphate propanoyltransferase n=1 Tax=Salipaludibacillus daqingensis TaxID=3041001 RepID=UPI002475D4DC|nr:phosphate propanoyltransferase [Salipaludibacillus daqingensis]